MPARTSRPPLLKPAPLARGDTIGIVAPASNIRREDLEAGCRALERLGYTPFYFDSILERDLYFAGSADRRLRELHAMFERPEVRAILCARGGYGCNYLLEHLDLDLVRRHPKIFIGYSDITTLLTWMLDAAGLATFHGPMAATAFASVPATDGWPCEVDATSWHVALSSEPAEWSLSSANHAGLRGLVSGDADGTLYGGCLSLLVASLGTPYELRTAGTVLFLEDVGEKPYRIDRMLIQLGLAGKLADVRGVVFGEMKDCLQPGGQEYGLEEVVTRVLEGFCPGKPVAFGLRSGHVTPAGGTLPFGVRARLEVRSGEAELRILESAVASTAKTG